MFIDAHAHFDDKRFNKDKYDVIDKLFEEKKVDAIINSGTNRQSTQISVELSKRYKNVFATAGFHPHDAKDMDDENFEFVRMMAKNEKTIAIGEIGLDYYYEFSDRNLQKKCFEKQLYLAKELNKPTVVHNRESTKDMVDILTSSEFNDMKILLHCFSESLETLKIFLHYDVSISVGGLVTFKNAKKILDVVKYIPDDRILLETDCPYMTPEPYRGKRNDSGYISIIAQKVAQIKDYSLEHLSEITKKNTISFFNLPL